MLYRNTPEFSKRLGFDSWLNCKDQFQVLQLIALVVFGALDKNCFLQFGAAQMSLPHTVDWVLTVKIPQRIFFNNDTIVWVEQQFTWR